MSKDIPTITGTPLHASDIMRNPAGTSTAPPPKEKWRPKSIMQLIDSIPNRTSSPEVAQLMILDAIEKFSAAASRLDVEAFNQTEVGQLVDGEIWKEVARQVSHIVTEHIDWANAREDKNMPKQYATPQAALDDYLARIIAHDWEHPLPADLIALGQRVDPQGELLDQHKPKPH